MEPMISLIAKPFEISQLPEVGRCLRQFFAIDDATLHHRFFRNPAHPESSGFLRGCVLYNGQTAVGFQGSQIRNAFWLQRPLIVCVHSLTCVLPEFSQYLADCIMPVFRQERVDVYLANTVNERAQRVMRGLRWNPGIQSNAMINVRVTNGARLGRVLQARNRWGRQLPLFLGDSLGAFGAWLLLAKQRLPALCSNTTCVRLYDINEQQFGDLWLRLLAGNRGMLMSRTPVELSWLFGKTLSRGDDVLLARFDGSHLVGYIIIRCCIISNGIIGRIMDWIAEDSDQGVLSDLLRDACGFAREACIPALELWGFPICVQEIVSRYFPFRRSVTGNPVWFFSRDKLLMRQIADDQQGWFWGPVDGDKTE